jgi:hypothetical protein
VASNGTLQAASGFKPETIDLTFDSDSDDHCAERPMSAEESTEESAEESADESAEESAVLI